MAEYLSQREIRKRERDRRRHQLEVERLELQDAVDRERSRRKAERQIRKEKRETTTGVEQRETMDVGWQRERTGEQRQRESIGGARPREIICGDTPREIIDGAKQEEITYGEKSREITDRGKQRELIDRGKSQEINEESEMEKNRNFLLNESDMDFTNQMTWIDEKLKELMMENIHKVSQEKEHGCLKQEYLSSSTEDDSTSTEDNEDAEEEKMLLLKIEQLRKQEQNMTKVIEHRKERKEKERKDRMEMEKRRQRIRALKEKERSLEESLWRKESILKQMDSSEEDECNMLPKRLTEDGCIEKRHNVEKMRRKERQLSFKKPTIPKLTEETFDEWKMEVEVILESGLYQEDIIRQEVRNSLCGNIRKTLLNIKPNATTRELIRKLENLYGNVRSGESIISEFYKSKQEENENVTEWGIRLESLINVGLNKRQILPSQKEEMLRNRFWRYLRNEKLKNATRMFYDSNIDFDELRRKVRIEENEMEAERNVWNMNCQQINGRDEQMEMMNRLLERMSMLEEKLAKHESLKEAGIKDEKTVDHNERSGQYSRGGYGNRGGYFNRGGYGNRGRNNDRAEYDRKDRRNNGGQDWRNRRQEDEDNDRHQSEDNGENRGEPNGNDRKTYNERHTKDLNE